VRQYSSRTDRTSTPQLAGPNRISGDFAEPSDLQKSQDRPLANLPYLLVVVSVGGVLLPLTGDLQFVMPDASASVEAIVIVALALLLLLRLSFSLDDAALASLVTLPVFAARQAGHTSRTPWILHLGMGTGQGINLSR
jgi:hypothetical protein